MTTAKPKNQPRKIRKTREEGQFARSQDLSVALLMIAVAIMFLFVGDDIAGNLLSALQTAFVFDASVISDSGQVGAYFSNC